MRKEEPSGKKIQHGSKGNRAVFMTAENRSY
jgi:hypothetical protein